MMKKIILFLCLLFLYGNMGNCYSSTKDTQLSIVSSSQLIVASKNNKSTYTFNFTINGYEMNCQGTKVILWGFPLKFNEGSPADNTYLLIDLQSQEIIKESLVSHGVFGARFFIDGKSVFLDTGNGLILNTNTGYATIVKSDVFEKLNDLSEKCIKPTNWSFNKFPS
ncbi:hypothetical protein [Buttiauxella agrestis]|uniref:hypothetical protein n=1 Tax=Buttiauxella agrestis TaxID=82977 RepID=UPI001E2AAFEC|nr:hypothetical protein [Buttiauxella agrestis]